MEYYFIGIRFPNSRIFTVADAARRNRDGKGRLRKFRTRPADKAIAFPHGRSQRYILAFDRVFGRVVCLCAIIQFIADRIVRKFPYGVERIFRIRTHRILSTVGILHYAVRICRPTGKSISFFHKCVSRKGRRRIGGYILAVHFAARSPVAVKDYFITVGSPNSEQFIRTLRSHCIFRTVIVHDAPGSALRPTGKSIALARKGIGSKVCSCIRCDLLRRHIPFAAVSVKDYFVDIRRPVCHDRSAALITPIGNGIALPVCQTGIIIEPAVENVTRTQRNGESKFTAEQDVLLRNGIPRRSAIIIKYNAQAVFHFRITAILPAFCPVGGDALTVADDDRFQPRATGKCCFSDIIYCIRYSHLCQTRIGKSARTDARNTIR